MYINVNDLQGIQTVFTFLHLSLLRAFYLFFFQVVSSLASACGRVCFCFEWGGLRFWAHTCAPISHLQWHLAVIIMKIIYDFGFLCAQFLLFTSHRYIYFIYLFPLSCCLLFVVLAVCLLICCCCLFSAFFSQSLLQCCACSVCATELRRLSNTPVEQAEAYDLREKLIYMRVSIEELGRFGSKFRFAYFWCQRYSQNSSKQVVFTNESYFVP